MQTRIETLPCVTGGSSALPVMASCGTDDRARGKPVVRELGEHLAVRASVGRPAQGEASDATCSLKGRRLLTDHRRL